MTSDRLVGGPDFEAAGDVPGDEYPPKCLDFKENRVCFSQLPHSATPNLVEQHSGTSLVRRARSEVCCSAPISGIALSFSRVRLAIKTTWLLKVANVQSSV